MAKIDPSPKHGSSPRKPPPPEGDRPLWSETPENRAGAINPSAPTDATEGPSTNLGLPDNPNSDSSGEIYHPDPKGNLDIGRANDSSARKQDRGDKGETEEKNDERVA